MWLIMKPNLHNLRGSYNTMLILMKREPQRFSTSIETLDPKQGGNFELSSYATLVQKTAIVERDSELYNREKNGKKGRASQPRKEDMGLKYKEPFC